MTYKDADRPSFATFIYSAMEVQAAGHHLTSFTLGQRVLDMCELPETQQAFQAELEQVPTLLTLSMTTEDHKILTSLARGVTENEIATDLALHIATIGRRIAKLRQHVECRTKEEAYRRYVEHGLIIPTDEQIVFNGRVAEAHTILTGGLVSRGWSGKLLARYRPSWLSDLDRMRRDTHRSISSLQAISRLFGAGLLIPDTILRNQALT